MASIVDRLETVVRSHIIDAVPPGVSPTLHSAQLRSVLAEYRAWRGRFIAPRPRAVHRSAELGNSDAATTHEADLGALEQKIAAGVDLTPHLSDRVLDPFENAAAPLPYRTDRDLLLANWGIHHLHLSTRLRGQFVKRGDDVLFAAFQDDDAYLVGVYRHEPRANWSAEEIFATIVRNWPDAGLVHQSDYTIGLAQQYDDEARKTLRETGLSTAMEIDGKVYSPGPFGATLDGISATADRAAMKVVAAIDGWRDDTYARLRRIEGAQPDGYWAPAIHTPTPGFEEYCGFQSGSTFVRVARLC